MSDEQEEKFEVSPERMLEVIKEIAEGELEENQVDHIVLSLESLKIASQDKEAFKKLLKKLQIVTSEQGIEFIQNWLKENE